MTKPYVSNYKNQIGNGIPGFRGMRNQKGYGFLSSLLTKSVIPLIKPLLSSINPASIFKSAKNTLAGPGLTPGSTLADDIPKLGAEATGSLIKTLQKGSGRKYKKTKRKTKTSLARRTSPRKHRNTKKKVRARKSKVTKQKKKKSKKSARKLKSIFF